MEAETRIRALTRRGMTNLSEGWLRGALIASGAESRGLPVRVILLSDGHANSGITDTAELSRHASELLARGGVTSALGIGDGYDEVLLAEIDASASTVVDDVVLTIELPPGGQADPLSLNIAGRMRDGLELHLGAMVGSQQRDTVIALHLPQGRAGDRLTFPIRLGGRDPVTGLASWRCIKAQGFRRARFPIRHSPARINPLWADIFPRISEVPTIMSDTGTEMRAKGAMVGLAIGDALGAPVEFRPRGSFAPVVGMRAGGRFRLPSGACTDDTAMALCLAESLLADPDLDERDLLERFCRWAEHGENSSTGIAVGIGQITLRRLGDFRRTGSLQAAPRTRGDGNGALMRVAPVAIRHFRDPQEAARIAIRQSRTTHASVLSEQCCAFAAHLIARLALGAAWKAALDEAQAQLQAPELVALFDRRNAAEPPPSTGYVVDTLESALWAVSRTTSFEAALLAAVNLGHDADTVGAVAGQIAGARYGLQAIPPRWLGTLVEGAHIEQMAAALAVAG